MLNMSFPEEVVTRVLLDSWSSDSGVYVAPISKGRPELLKFDMYWRHEAERMLMVDILDLVPEFDSRLVEAKIEDLRLSDANEDVEALERKRSFLDGNRFRYTSRGWRVTVIIISYKKSIVREFAAIFDRDRFESSLDGTDSAHLLCFEDGVYDLNKSAWRDAASDDMISVCTNYPLRVVPVDPEVRESIKRILFAPFEEVNPVWHNF